ncbi:MAG TPA: PqqD family peptide modification chaperone [Thermoanaerobaculaceae bacterium]|nr:PqqD family peptide modification chaperone [Thermoanaerobaculaceae bacterium]
MNAIEPGACWMREPSVRTFTIGESGFELYAPDSGVTRYLNETASFIWQLLDGEQSLSQVARELAAEFEGCTAEQALADVVELAGSLASEGLAQPTSGTRIRPVWPGCEAGIAPREWDVALTGKCNLSCSYCFFANEMVGRNDLSTEQWTRFFETLGKLPTRSVCLSGGEVFVRKDLWELLDCVVANGLRYSILSNGTLIREDTITKLCEPARRRRLSSIQVSIDGSCAAVHDASRGAGSFERALRAVRLLKDAGFPLTVRLTINKYNVDDLEAAAKLLLEDVGLPSFSTNDAMPMGAGCSNQGDITLSPQQQVQAMRTLERLATRYDGRITATAGPLAKVKMHREMEQARATGTAISSYRAGHLTACGCIFSKLAVNHDGTITPCSILATVVLGHIEKDSIPELWRSDPVLTKMRSRHTIAMRDLPECQGCEWHDYCNGSCPGLAYEQFGDVNRANLTDCYRRFLEATKDAN